MDKLSEYRRKKQTHSLLPKRLAKIGETSRDGSHDISMAANNKCSWQIDEEDKPSEANEVTFRNQQIKLPNVFQDIASQHRMRSLYGHLWDRIYPTVIRVFRFGPE